MLKMRRLVIIFIMIGLWATAQGGTLKASLVTCYPGEEIYELDGHTALRLTSEAYDGVVSWGLFDFNSPNFLYRFVKGETDYMAGDVPFDIFVENYRRAGRKVVEQPLEADSAALERLLEMVVANLRPENRVYRYNYVKDNCATRPMQLIELSGCGAFDNDYVSTDRTFRRVMRTYHKNYPWYQFGIDFALGSGIDYPISPHEQAFSPMLLMQMLDVEPHVLVPGNDHSASLPPTPWYLTPMAVFIALMAAVAVACAMIISRRKLFRWIYCVFFGAAGLAGCLLTFLIFISVHEATSPNFLYIFFNPLCLIPAIFIWVKGCRKLVVCYLIVNFALIILGGALWPLTGQSMNLAIIPVLVADALLSVTYIYLYFKDKTN